MAINKVWADERLVKLDGVTYRWCGGLGAVLISEERWTKAGTLRLFGDVVMRASGVNRIPGNPFKNELVWVPIGDFDHDWIRSFREALFM